MTLRRGFKAQAEAEALRTREALGLPPYAVIEIELLAKHLGIRVVDGGALVQRNRYEEIERIQAFAFSAVTFELDDGSKAIVKHPLRGAGRQASDIAHELAHIMLDHELSQIEVIAGAPFRTCLPDQEEEATAFGGTLLLPRPLLLRAVRRGWDADEVAKKCGVTAEMARYRLNTTGVIRQVRPGLR